MRNQAETSRRVGSPDYTEFDAELVAQIKAGRNRMLVLECCGTLLDMAKPFCTVKTPDWRIIDRRLQALRKAGKISFNGKEWEAAV